MFLNDNIKVFSGSSDPSLTASVCNYLGVTVGGAKVEKFPDGEKMVKLEDDVRGRDCFVIQSTCHPVDEYVMELLIYLDCIKRASAKRITAVIPYFGYARQDRKDEGRVPITAKLMANIITNAGADRVLTIDLHAQQLQGFFDIPVDHLTGELVLSEYFKSRKFDNLVIVSPDVGNMKTASRYAQHLGGELAIVHKKRVSGEKVTADTLIGDVEGKNVLMCDDIIATGGTVSSAVELVKNRGAKNVYLGATHGVFAGEALEKLEKAGAAEIVVTDTIPLRPDVEQCKLIKVLSVAPMLGEAIKRIHRNESISSLFGRS